MGLLPSLFFRTRLHSDPAADMDARQGLPPVRSPWITARGDTGSYTGRTPFALDDGLREAQALTEGMATMSAAFKRAGGEIYIPMALA